MFFKIREPIWKNHSIGLNESKLEDENEVVILYENRMGEREYPFTYTISRSKALTFPCMTVRGNRLRIIPIFELGIKTNGTRIQ